MEILLLPDIDLRPAKSAFVSARVRFEVFSAYFRGLFSSHFGVKRITRTQHNDEQTRPCRRDVQKEEKVFFAE
jgi:hypothetical protein